MRQSTSPPTSTQPVRAGSEWRLVIQAGRSDLHYWRDLWSYRELLAFLAWRDVKVRYKQAVLGASWALIQPAVTTVIFTVLFGRLANMPAGGVPYPLLVMSGLLAWQLFSSALSGTGGSLVGNANLISKVYFPRLIIPFSALGVALIDFSIVLGFFAVLSLWFGQLPSWHWLALPLFVLLALTTALGAGLWLTALTVKYRDFRFITPFLLQIGIFVSPVGFRTDYFPNWESLLALNPLTGIINGFRWCLLGGAQAVNWTSVGTGLCITTILLLTGLWFFRKTERILADVI